MSIRPHCESCYLCGATTDLTRDHVPPKGFFPKPLPGNLITVSCCHTCNHGWSKEDEATCQRLLTGGIEAALRAAKD